MTPDGDTGALPLTGPRWRLAAARISQDGGFKQRIDAVAGERAALQEALGLDACERVTADVSCKAIGRDRFQAGIRLRARITRTCVVSLEPFDQVLAETAQVEFWPPEALERFERERLEAAAQAGPDRGGEVSGDEPDREPLVDDALDLGRVVYELMVVALEPHPRAPGVAFEWLEGDDIDDDTPFAALTKLRDGDPR